MILGPSRSSFASYEEGALFFLSALAKQVTLSSANYPLSHYYLCIIAPQKSKNRQRTRWRTVLNNMAGSHCLLIFLKCRKGTPNFFKAIIFAC